MSEVIGHKERMHVIQKFKIMNSLDDELFFQTDDGGRRGHDKKIV